MREKETGLQPRYLQILLLKKKEQLSMSAVARARSNKVKLQQDEACRKCL